LEFSLEPTYLTLIAIDKIREPWKYTLGFLLIATFYTARAVRALVPAVISQL